MQAFFIFNCIIVFMYYNESIKGWFIYMQTIEEFSNRPDYISWDPKFELGIPVIDAQHKTLVELCNNVYQKLLTNQNNEQFHEVLKDALRQCANYVQTHFKDEEILMKACNYSLYENHKARHDEFTEKVIYTVEHFDSVNLIDAFQFVEFLYDWILTHIAHEDKQFSKPVIEYYKNLKEHQK